jgi:thiosulfate sulfurtransferase
MSWMIEGTAMYKQISCQEAYELINQGNLLIADVRDKLSYDAEHINNAVHLSVSTFNEFCQGTHRELSILVYCYHGISSQSVAQHLVDHGFSKVYSLIGGFETWKSHQPASDKN